MLVDAIVALDTSSKMRLANPNLVRMESHWLIHVTQQHVHPVSEKEGEKKEKQKKKNKTKISLDFIHSSTFSKINIDPLVEYQPP